MNAKASRGANGSVWVDAGKAVLSSPMGNPGLHLGGDGRKWSVSPDPTVGLNDSDTAAKRWKPEVTVDLHGTTLMRTACSAHYWRSGEVLLGTG